MTDEKRCTVIVGVGNDLMSDDGAGIRLLDLMVEWLKENPIEGVSTHYGNTDPKSLWISTEGEKCNYILLDAITLGNQAGTVYRFMGEEFDRFLKQHGSRGGFHAHDISIFDMIIHSNFAGIELGKIALIGIEPQKIELGLELTPAVQKSLEKAKDLVIDTLKQFGHRF